LYKIFSAFSTKGFRELKNFFKFVIIYLKDVIEMVAIVDIDCGLGDIGKWIHHYYFSKEIGEDELNFEISQLKEFYDIVVVLEDLSSYGR
jgi:hypothetical protein